MSQTNNESLRYPIGRYRPPDMVTHAHRAIWIPSIAALPSQLSAAVKGLTENQLDTPYRDGGWTVRQVVHHVADSHMNSQVRFRWALTEDVPLIKAYEESLWATLPDARSGPPQVSLDLIDALHRRWTALLGGMTEADFERRFRHPASGEVSLNQMVGLYAWHGVHHVTHITRLRERMAW